MAKYTSDTNLIKGAATAYRNYDNVAGMYAGLDKVTKAGTDMMGEAVKGYEAEQEKIKKEQEKLEEEARKEQEKTDKLNDNWNTLASGVYESAGSFMKDVEYKDTVASVKALRQEYIDAQNSKDAEKMAEVKIKFNNINAEVNAHKEFRALLTNPEYGMSDFVKGDNLEYMNGFINEDYVIGRNDKKEKTYTVNGVTKNMKEINEMVGVKDNVPYGKYGKLLNDYSTSKTKGDRNSLELGIRNGVVPDNTNGLRAFLNDDGFGNGQTFSDLLNADGNKASIEKEIMNTIFDDGDGVITQTEYDNFVNAIVSPDNEFWKNNGGASAWKNQARRIATEQLANGAENAWDTNPANKTTVIPGGTGTDKPLFNPNQHFPLGQGGGYVMGGAINGMVNKIKVGRSFKFEDNNYDHVDGGWYLNYNDGTKEGEEKSTPESDNYIGDAETLIFNAFGEGGNDSRFNDITTKKLKIIDPESGEVVASSVDTRQEETFDTKTNLDINFLNKTDEAVAAKLNDLIPSSGDTRNPNAYTFKPLGSFENLTGIYKEGGGIERFPKVYPEGHPKAGEKHPKAGRQAHFKTKGKTTASNTENLAEMIDLLQTFGLYEYIPKQLP